ncbi:TPA: DUF334 domain-containing protein [Staphylococcus aureus]|nr:DUF334 domain-containing protein [Listeria monocytogenes]HAU5831778.1 DUF334 domain-containing protein [Staphylococcus aureus]HAU5873270.1 DUF334 domain-containing protein [Staphylococcus aureus]HAU5881143.1 DUF334 domain-containing protein [Staphylococcus aureus]HAU6040253.1 DUF334 domain-containing protein [Staphylococcus aureus]
MNLNSRIKRVDELYVKELTKRLDKVNIKDLSQNLREDIDTARDNTQELLEEIKKSQETYKKRQKWLFNGIVVAFLAFILFSIVTTVGHGFWDMLQINELQKAMRGQIKHSEGFWVILWYLLYYLPYALFIGLCVALFEWIRRKYVRW